PWALKPLVICSRILIRRCRLYVRRGNFRIFLVLLLPQGVQWIDSRGAARRNIGSSETRSDHQHRGQDEYRWRRSTHAKQKSGNPLPCKETADETKSKTAGNKYETTTEDHTEKISTIRTNCDPNADIARSLSNSVRHRTVNPDQRKHQC